MKERLVPFLACPDCDGDLELGRVDERDGAEIMEGGLGCRGCRRTFAVHGGVPRLVPLDLAGVSVEVAEGFGWQWNRFDEIRPHYRQQFLDWIHPVVESDFHGRRVLEGGCGKGRHSALAAEFGASDVFAVDLGSAVETAFRNTRRYDAVHVIQGDVTRLPLRRAADLAFSVGVLHHLPVPVAGLRALADHVVPGGRIVVWVYGREGNEWIVRLVDPVRTRVTARLPRRLLYTASTPLGWAVAAAAKGLYRPLARLAPSLHERLFYREYLTYIARFPTREIHNIVFDQLVTPVAYYLRRDEVEEWFRDPRFSAVSIEHHNGNSWRATALIEPPAA